MDIKCVVVGDGMVGKTSLLMRYTSAKFPSDYVPTVFDNMTKTVEIDGVRINLSLWDTAGQEGYDRLRLLAYPQTDVFVLCFSLVNEDSLMNLRDKWLPEIQQQCRGTPFILVGTKHDLRASTTTPSPSFKPVTTAQGRAMLRSMEAATYIESSALTGKSVPQVFEEAVRAKLYPATSAKSSSRSRSKLKKCTVL